MTSRTTALLCLAVALPLVESLGLLRKGPLQRRDAANQELASLFQEDTKALTNEMFGSPDISMSMPAIMSFSMPLLTATTTTTTIGLTTAADARSSETTAAASPTLRTVTDVVGVERFSIHSSSKSENESSYSGGDGRMAAGAITALVIVVLVALLAVAVAFTMLLASQRRRRRSALMRSNTIIARRRHHLPRSSNNNNNTEVPHILFAGDDASNSDMGDDSLII